MTKQTVTILIRVMLILLAVTGLVCLLMMHRIVEYLLPGFSVRTHSYWLYAIYACAFPCFMALLPAWRIAGNIRRNRSFTLSTAKSMRAIGWLMVCDTVLVLITNTVLYAIGRSFFAFFIAVFLIVACFFAAAVCAFSCSYLLRNATSLQEQSDFTI
ncbi:MAG: DUF2975 domain-containing protein [Eubacterium sp.]|nr:DUF2975 domain-containing protein [Eubacterium sp.]